MNSRFTRFSLTTLLGVVMAMALAETAFANELNSVHPISSTEATEGDCQGQTLSAGQVLWHFVHTQTGSSDPTPGAYTLTATFSAAGPKTAPSYFNGQIMYFIITNSEDTLNDASDTLTNSGNLNLSHVCHGPPLITEAMPPTVTKDATGSYDNTYTWMIHKVADNTIVKQIGGTATFNYTVSVSHDAGTASKVKVTGTITVTNPNAVAVTLNSITDVLSDSTPCTVSGGSLILASGNTTFDYVCNSIALPSGALTNKATVSWLDQTLSDNSHLAAGSADITTNPINLVGTDIDECVNVSDPIAGAVLPPATVCVASGVNPTEFNYSRVVNVPSYDCVSYDNTATFTTNDTGATGSSSQTVKVCGPAKTGALTIGYWQNKNGQAIITGGASTGGVCNSGTWLRQYAPYQDLSATATCSQVAAYVYGIIKAADASGTAMNAMLKAQMLATALDVYFSNLALGGNMINAPAPIGGISVDLTKICTDLTCTAFEDSSSVFGGSPKTVLEMLTNAASQSNPGGTVWYGQDKPKQELAKDAFDALNNQKVFAAGP